jgi:hypothetical protein
MTHWRNYEPCHTCGASDGRPCLDTRENVRSPYRTNLPRPHRGRINARIVASREAWAARNVATS